MVVEVSTSMTRVLGDPAGSSGSWSIAVMVGRQGGQGIKVCECVVLLPSSLCLLVPLCYGWDAGDTSLLLLTGLFSGSSTTRTRGGSQILGC